MTTSHEAPKKRQLPTVYTLLFIIIALMAAQALGLDVVLVTNDRAEGSFVEAILRALEDALLEFAGCVLVISHDRWFLDRIATHMLAFEGDSRVVFFEGNYHDYEADRVKRLGAEAARPTRVKFKRLA